jgi:hypothetical protein
MLLPRHQNAGQSYDIKIANRCGKDIFSVSQAVKRRLVGRLVNNEVGRIWKEAVGISLEDC